MIDYTLLIKITTGPLTVYPAIIEDFLAMFVKMQFVNTFRSEESYNVYIETMPWLRIPFSQEERRKKLARALDVQAIPTLVILDPRDNIITLDGRAELLEDPEGLVINETSPLKQLIFICYSMDVIFHRIFHGPVVW